MTIEQAKRIINFSDTLDSAISNSGKYAISLYEIITNVLPETFENRQRFRGFMGGTDLNLDNLSIYSDEFGEITEIVQSRLELMKSAKQRMAEVYTVLKEKINDEFFDFSPIKSRAHAAISGFSVASLDLKNLIQPRAFLAKDALLNSRTDFQENLLKNDLRILVNNFSNYLNVGIDGNDFGLEEALRRLKMLSDFFSNFKSMSLPEMSPTFIQTFDAGLLKYQNALQMYRDEDYFSDETVSLLDEATHDLMDILEDKYFNEI